MSLADLTSDRPEDRELVRARMREARAEPRCCACCGLCSPAHPQAFVGPYALGLVTVTGVAELPEHRATLLPLAAQLAGLPPARLAAYEHAASKFSVGWSCGKEQLAHGQPDVLKGSFYANPVHDSPADGVAATTAAQHPSAREWLQGWGLQQVQQHRGRHLPAHPHSRRPVQRQHLAT